MKYGKPVIRLVSGATKAILGQSEGSKQGSPVFDNSPINTTYVTGSAYEADE